MGSGVAVEGAPRDGVAHALSRGGGRAAQQELRPPMPAASAPPTDLGSVEAGFVHYR